MKVLLRRNVRKLGQIGQIVEVTAGYARNYLLPQRLAVVPSRTNVKAVETEKQAYMEELARQRVELEARAKLLEGKEFTITARANEEGHLYGSVGPAQIAAAVVKDGFDVQAQAIALEEPIRKLDKYEVAVQFAEGVTAKIVVWVVPPREEAAPQPAEAEAASEGQEPPVAQAPDQATPTRP